MEEMWVDGLRREINLQPNMMSAPFFVVLAYAKSGPNGSCTLIRAGIQTDHLTTRLLAFL